MGTKRESATRTRVLVTWELADGLGSPLEVILFNCVLGAAARYGEEAAN